MDLLWQVLFPMLIPVCLQALNVWPSRTRPPPPPGFKWSAPNMLVTWIVYLHLFHACLHNMQDIRPPKSLSVVFRTYLRNNGVTGGVYGGHCHCSLQKLEYHTRGPFNLNNITLEKKDSNWRFFVVYANKWFNMCVILLSLFVSNCH